MVALAGIGLRVLRSSGKLEVDLDVPTDHVILSDNGLRLLALRFIGDEAIAVAAIALPERRVRRLGELPATTWSPTFDGANWFLAHHHQLWMLDMLPEGPVALWRHGQPEGRITAVARRTAQLVVASAAGTGSTNTN